MARVTYPGYKKYIYVRKKMVRVNLPGQPVMKKPKKHISGKNRKKMGPKISRGACKLSWTLDYKKK